MLRGSSAAVQHQMRLQCPIAQQATTHLRSLSLPSLANNSTTLLSAQKLSPRLNQQQLQLQLQQPRSDFHSSSLAQLAKPEQPLTPRNTSPRVQTMAAAVPSRLSENTLNSKVISAQYAVRGQLVIRAEQLKAELALGKVHNGFTKIIQCNIGNPHELGQQPISFFRQVLSLVHYPPMIDNIEAEMRATSDDLLDKVHELKVPVTREAIARARDYLEVLHSTGSYTNSAGIPLVREQVAEFIRRRDGLTKKQVSADHIFLTDGASSAVKIMMQLLIRDERDCVMTPVPQYPLYSATLSLLGGTPTPYYLDESQGWSLNKAELERAFAAKDKTHHARALVIINPGNPTGQCLNEETMHDIIEFAEKHHLVLLADEVYQTNVYAANSKFTSFKKLVSQRNSQVQLVSFHSTSKGFLGECGQRGGYMELTNIDPQVTAQIYKLASISLCSNTSGQLMTGLMCSPPDESTQAGKQYAKERDAVLASLARRAAKVSAKLNECEGISCNEVEGALYAFPRIRLPQLAIEEARKRNQQPDTMYCLELLEHTGLCVVPGSGFGQRDGTFHFRTTILPGEQILDEVMGKLKQFNHNFMLRWAST